MSADRTGDSGDDPVAALRRGDRRTLARAITLIESTRPDHRARAAALLAAVMPWTGASVRIGISGAPGAGKSTFIEAFGLHLAAAGAKIAVLAVDPSSVGTGGSILGDKTRMAGLAVHPAAFIRPQPSGGLLGGVARHTGEAVLLCEAAGHGIVIVETVGVGQSETAVADLVDLFVLLLAPGGGDSLQGLKKGIVERADLLVVTKADGALAAAATQTVAEYGHALGLLRPAADGVRPPVLSCSALTGAGIGAVAEAIADRVAAAKASGHFQARRRDQAGAWLWAEIAGALTARFRADPAIRAALPAVEAALRDGTLVASVAADRLLALFLDESACKTDKSRAFSDPGGSD